MRGWMSWWTISTLFAIAIYPRSWVGNQTSNSSHSSSDTITFCFRFIFTGPKKKILGIASKTTVDYVVWSGSAWRRGSRNFWDSSSPCRLIEIPILSPASFLLSFSSILFSIDKDDDDIILLTCAHLRTTVRYVMMTISVDKNG